MMEFKRNVRVIKALIEIRFQNLMMFRLGFFGPFFVDGSLFIIQLMVFQAIYSNVDRIDVTRPWRDGGRDAVGDYLLGPDADPVAVEFALEAKCYAPGHGVGVRETSRLISRLRHRQFGVLVTTSHLDSQAYKEIREDGHPVIVLAGRDITDILKKSGLDTTTALRRHLHDNYPQR